MHGGAVGIADGDGMAGFDDVGNGQVACNKIVGGTGVCNDGGGT